MKKTNRLFGIAGIRGKFGEKITAELVFKVCQSIAELYPSKNILVGHDARTSSEALSQCATAAVSLAGGKIFSLGLCSFPVIANLTLDEKYGVAIYITASHNPPTDNGIKILKEGREFTEREQNDIEKMIEKNYTDGFSIFHNKWDMILPQEVVLESNNRYMKRIKNEIQLNGDGRKIILDCANGPMSELAPKLLSLNDFEIKAINCNVDGHFPGRLAEPSPKNLTNLIQLCKNEKAMGAAFDGDGDRIAIIDETGTFVELSRMNALLALLEIKEHGPGKVIVSIDSSTTIDKTVEKVGGEVIRTKLGELHGKIEELEAKGEKVAFASEPWKPIFPKWGRWIDGLLALHKLLKVIINNQTTVSEIMKQIPEHIAERKAYLVEGEKVEGIYDKCKLFLAEYLEKEKKETLKIDGLRYDLQDGTWILIRKSGTEPKIRIYYESPTEERFKWIENIVHKMEQLITS